MNRCIFFTGILLGIHVGVAVASEIEKANQKKFEAERHADLADLHKSFGVVMDKIRSGEYNEKSLEEVLSDFEFYIIANRESRGH